MSTPASILYSFVADTCVLVVIAYLLARGSLLALLFRERLARREAASLGLLLGLVGLIEAVFPDARFRYATHTLFVTFAGIAGGLRVGLVTAAVVTVGAFFLQTPEVMVGTMLAACVGALLGKSVRRVAGVPARLIGGFAVGALAQACRLLIHFVLAGLWRSSFSLANAWISVPANGFGVMLLLLVVSDAQVRAESEQRRLEMEHASALASEAQLAALRARVHPHFLFNALTSIAALCGVAPDRAEATLLRLSQLMRRALETSAERTVCLDEEIEATQTYVQIEQERFGPRLRVLWRVDPRCGGVLTPPFALQTLVENAVNHGIAPKAQPGAIEVTVRLCPRYALVAVRDNGVGMSAETRRRVLSAENGGTRGLQILNQHLILLHGPRARLRLFSKEEAGTLAVFVLPIQEHGKQTKEAGV